MDMSYCVVIARREIPCVIEVYLNVMVIDYSHMELELNQGLLCFDLKFEDTDENHSTVFTE